MLNNQSTKEFLHYSAKRLVAIVSVSLLLLFVVQFQVSANFASPTELRGYAWSSNIGWISMNCDDGYTNTCTTSDYKVQINPDFTLTGYAWSSNIGWVKFGGLSDCPSVSSCTAEVDPDTNELLGWARACAGTVNGDCGSMVSRSDGWDGWISLNCLNTGGCATSDYGVNVGFGSMSDYAWGSDVVGWVSFDYVNFTSPCTPGTTCVPGASETYDQWCRLLSTQTCGSGYQCTVGTGCVAIIPTATFSAFPQFVRAGDVTELSWSVVDSTSCRVVQNTSDVITIDNTNLVSSGTTNPLVAETEFRLYCLDVLGLEHLVGTAVVTVNGTLEEI